MLYPYTHLLPLCYPDTSPLCKISNVSARYTRIQLPHEFLKLRVKF
ncbi:hypothetical protein CAMGR0001_2699 [Campylobacter gracilis RM3268]|uniref:Uncharacterized protein n=1 Tax=Campylobacter gracilis RM3268 TaxID=553220 RepID=C8PF58_9BACT|nr:hypothetical protein CAMGR0001_2699 [Campylobacter gracilis RM3268]